MRMAGTVVFFFAVAGANIFLILYTVLARWWKTPIGRHLFSFMTAIALALNYIVVQLIWPEAPYRMHTRFVLYGALAIVIWWRIIILITVQVRGIRGTGTAANTQEDSRNLHGYVDRPDGADTSHVEGQHPVGGGDERLGKRGGTLRGLPGSEGRGLERKLPPL